ncbi:MAG: transcription antitermination factor NusB [Thermomicrobiales bacterium]
MSDHTDRPQPEPQPSPTHPGEPGDTPASPLAANETPAAAKASRKRRPKKGSGKRAANQEEAAARQARYLSRRHHGRVLAMQMLFEQDVAQHDLDDILERMRTDPDEPVPNVTGEYAIKLTTGIRAMQDEIDARIGAAAPTFPVEQLASIDRNVMRIAIWEMATDEVPVRVSINEAVEIAKHYGGPSSGKFVNGVLGTIARQLSQEKAAALEATGNDPALAAEPADAAAILPEIEVDEREALDIAPDALPEGAILVSEGEDTIEAVPAPVDDTLADANEPAAATDAEEAEAPSGITEPEDSPAARDAASDLPNPEDRDAASADDRDAEAFPDRTA